MRLISMSRFMVKLIHMIKGFLQFLGFFMIFTLVSPTQSVNAQFHESTIEIGSSLLNPLINNDHQEPIIIVIDPGHSTQFNDELEQVAPGIDLYKRKYGVGAVGNLTGIMERDIVLNVSLILKDLLQKENYIVYITRENHLVMLSNFERVEIANYVQADLMIRIHADSSLNTKAEGASILYPSTLYSSTDIVEKSHDYASIILDTLVEDIGMKRLGLFERNDQAGFNWSLVPVITVEMGFLSNAHEEKMLSLASYQNRLAHSLKNGINKLFKH